MTGRARRRELRCRTSPRGPAEPADGRHESGASALGGLSLREASTRAGLRFAYATCPRETLFWLLSFAQEVIGGSPDADTRLIGRDGVPALGAEAAALALRRCPVLSAEMNVDALRLRRLVPDRIVPAAACEAMHTKEGRRHHLPSDPRSGRVGPCPRGNGLGAERPGGGDHLIGDQHAGEVAESATLRDSKPAVEAYGWVVSRRDRVSPAHRERASRNSRSGRRSSASPCRL